MIRPIGDKVLLKVNDAVETTSSGLFLAPTATRKNHAVVVAVGDGRDTLDGTVIPLRVKVDDKVLIVPGTGIEVTNNGEKFLMMKEHEILAVLDNPAEKIDFGTRL